MSESKALRGLACPQCGGTVPIPEGQAVVRCPYCDQRSLVRGERGVRRYQVPQRVELEEARRRLRAFLSGHRAIAGNAASQARLDESLLVHLPFWTVWAQVLGWVFGQKRVRRGRQTTYVAKEVKVAEQMTWGRAACDVGEFGVTEVPVKGRPLEPFDPEGLHASGLVFEPVGSTSDAQAAAERDFNQRVRDMAGLDQIQQVFVRFVRRQLSIVYYPLWVLRYLYRGRAFQVVVDGYSGEVLYGKAPGSTLYRAVVLVGGMALGALLSVDGAALAFYIASQVRGRSVIFLVGAGVAAIGAGVVLMRRAYRAFRYGEQYEYRGYQPKRRVVRRTEGGVLRAREEG